MSRLLQQSLFRPLKEVSLFFPGPNGPNGSLLILSLWVLIILSVLSCALGNFISGQIKFTNSFIRSTVSLPLAKAACRDAFFERKLDSTKDYDSEKELVSQKQKVFKNNIKYKYYFQDECAKININTASKDILQRLPGLDEDSADAIINSGLRPFRLKEEVLLVDGVSKENFNQFKDFITVYGDGKVNINAAPAEALSALGLEKELVEIIILYRKDYPGADGHTDTDDDGAFLSVSEILSELRKFEMLSLRQEQDLLSAMNVLSVKSMFLCLKVSTEVMGKAGNSYSIVIEPANRKIVSWSE